MPFLSLIFSTGGVLNQMRTDKRTNLFAKFVRLAHLVLIANIHCLKRKQMAKELRYTLTPSAPSKPKGVLCVVVGYKGTPQGRKYYVINGLTSPDFRYWDKKARRFTSGTDTAKANNPVLDAICERCDELLNNSAITSPSDGTFGW